MPCIAKNESTEFIYDVFTYSRKSACRAFQSQNILPRAPCWLSIWPKCRLSGYSTSVETLLTCSGGKASLGAHHKIQLSPFNWGGKEGSGGVSGLVILFQRASSRWHCSRRAQDLHPPFSIPHVGTQRESVLCVAASKKEGTWMPIYWPWDKRVLKDSQGEWNHHLPFGASAPTPRTPKNQREGRREVCRGHGWHQVILVSSFVISGARWHLCPNQCIN